MLGNSYGQLNMDLLDQIDYPQVLSSLWGYIDPEDGTEYAAVGTSTGLSVVDLSDPTNVVEIAFIPDVNSQWREVKSYGHYIYAVTEGGGGVLVVNMSDPANVTSTHWAPNIPGLGQLNTIHSITVDEFGFLYLNGSNLNSGGVLIVDVSADNGTPVYVAKAPAIYCHDSYVRNNILYTSDIYAGNLSIYDITDKSNIQLLATQQTPYAFTHNSWLNNASTVTFTTDEKANAPVAAYDISDLTDIKLLDEFRPVATLGNGAIPHNVHVWDDWIITAYYTEGTIIVDGSRPDNLIEVGYFDSFVSQSAGFYGVWGVYPYFPSGLVIASDMQNGLLVYQVDYVRACWLEGKVTSSATGLPILGASVHIESAQANTGSTDINGIYKTGQALPGTFDVVFSASGYNSKTVPAVLENGVLTILDVQLDPQSSFSMTGQTIRADNGSPVEGAKVVLQNSSNTFTATSDANGNFSFSNVFADNYELVAAAWGFQHSTPMNVSVSGSSVPVVIPMKKGYQDDFFADLGWTSTATANSGDWELGEPVGTDFNGSASNTDFDLPDDIGNQCYVTGNGGGDAGTDDVDGGTVTLTSPVMDLTSYNEPLLRYTTWFFNAGGNGQPNDALTVRVSNGSTEVVLETITQSGSNWRPESEFNLAALIPLTNNMRVTFTTGDLANSGHLVEAAVDGFLLFDNSPYPPFSVSSNTGCTDFTVQFSDSSDSSAVWQWFFEGGTPATSAEQNPTVVYSTPGVFDVTLIVVTDDGNSYTIERPNSITVGTAPVAGFNPVINGNVVDFENTSTGDGSFVWNFGDNSTSTMEDPSHVYTQPGIYTVVLTTTNACGSSSISFDVEVFSVPPTAIFTYSNPVGCAPFTVQFTDASLGQPGSWAWEFPGGTPSTSSDQNPVVVYTNPGVFSAQLTVQNAAGTSQISQSQFIEIGAAPAASFTFDITGSEAVFTNNSTNSNAYEWEFGDGSAVSTEVNPSHAFPQPGEYEVTLTATNDCGFAVSTQTVEIVASAVGDLEKQLVQLSAAPNPFSSTVTLNYDLGGSDNAAVAVFGPLGVKIIEKPLTAAQGSVVLGEELYQPGLYLVQLLKDGRTVAALKINRL